jgi:AcrR family transcriptional regulator
MPRTEQAFQQIRDERRLQILDKAAVVFATRGLADTKIGDIAEAADISQGLLYRYFVDKDDMFIAILERAVGGVLRLAEQAVAQPGTPWDRLLWLTDRFLTSLRKEPLYYQIFSQALSIPGAVHDTIEKFHELVDVLLLLIREGQTAGQITPGDPEQLMLLYLCCIYGLAAGTSVFHRSLIKHFPDAKAVLQILKT